MGRIGLTINTRTKKVYYVSEMTGTACCCSLEGQEATDSDNMKNETALLKTLKAKYPEVFSEGIGEMRGYEHEIRLKPGTMPIQMGMRRIPHSKEEPTIKELERDIGMGVMEKVPGRKSEWNSPLHAVMKPEATGGGVRVTADFSGTINPFIIPTLHPVPLPAEIFKKARHARVFSKLDLVKAYWHLRIAEHCRHFTAFMTQSHGLLQYARLPMGMTDSAASFQKAIEHCLQGIDNVAPYIDDILIWGSTQEEHDEALDKVFSRLNRDGFRVSPQKCSLSRTQITMLGQQLTVMESGLDICPDPTRTTAVLDAPSPQNIKQLHRFLGMANYFSNYIPRYATIAEPLFRLKRKSVAFEWTEACEDACRKIKEAIAQPAVCVPFEPECEVHVQTDASNTGLGACLMIERAGELRPVAFASKTMTAAERNYSTPEQEALATVWGIEKFNQYVFGRHFTLHSDQSSLRRLLNGFADKPTISRRIQRWYDRLRRYDFKPVHIKGEKNVIADYLSRLGEDAPPAEEPTLPEDNDEVILVSALSDTTITHEELKATTAEDTACRALMRYIKNGWPNIKHITIPALRHFHKCKTELSTKDGLIFHGERIVVPEVLRPRIMHRLHLGHPGIVRMKNLYSDLYYWPSGRVDCEAHVQMCIPCSHAEKSVKPTAVPTGQFPPPKTPWEVLALDITGPFWEAPERHENIVVLIDYFSKWPELLFTKDTTSATITRWLTDVFDSWGNPLEIVTDNGPQFVSDEFEEFLAARNIKHQTTPVYCPQRNGLVERFNRVIKNSAQVHAGHRSHFRRHIMETVVSFRAIAPEASESPATLARGWNMRTSSSIFNPRFTDGGVGEREPLDLQSREKIVRDKANRRKYGKNLHAPPAPGNGKNLHAPPAPGKHRSIFRVGEIVQIVRPKTLVHKGQSPLSRPIRIVSQVSRWDFRLADGKIWNARRLRRFRPAMFNARYQGRDFEFDEGPEDQDTYHVGPPAVRRGTRDRRPPQRYIEQC